MTCTTAGNSRSSWGRMACPRRRFDRAGRGAPHCWKQTESDASMVILEDQPWMMRRPPGGTVRNAHEVRHEEMDTFRIAEGARKAHENAPTPIPGRGGGW